MCVDSAYSYTSCSDFLSRSRKNASAGKKILLLKFFHVLHEILGIIMIRTQMFLSKMQPRLVSIHESYLRSRSSSIAFRAASIKSSIR